jgi:pilus assembly protein Flp/PilA
MKKLINFFKEDDGATMVEYGIMVALIAVVGIATIRVLGTTTRDTFGNVNTSMGGVNP